MRPDRLSTVLSFAHTKIHIALTPRQRHEMIAADELLEVTK